VAAGSCWLWAGGASKDRAGACQPVRVTWKSDDVLLSSKLSRLALLWAVIIRSHWVRMCLSCCWDCICSRVKSICKGASPNGSLEDSEWWTQWQLQHYLWTMNQVANCCQFGFCLTQHMYKLSVIAQTARELATAWTAAVQR